MKTDKQIRKVENKMQRIMLKLSGEALAGEKKTGFDEETVRKVALQEIGRAHV